MLYGKFEAKIELPLFVRGAWGRAQSICVTCKVRSGQGDVRSMECDVHRPQLWSEGSGTDSFPAGPRGPQLQHFWEKRETNHGLIGNMMVELGLCSQYARD